MADLHNLYARLQDGTIVQLGGSANYGDAIAIIDARHRATIEGAI